MLLVACKSCARPSSCCASGRKAVVTFLNRRFCAADPQKNPVKRLRSADRDEGNVASPPQIASPPLSSEQLQRIQKNKQAALQKLAVRPRALGIAEYIKPYFRKQPSRSPGSFCSA
ncbi:uracil-DNA glycosylase-like [Rhinatrema bivittatum]|uniref:uracil-DNA glycosylase-like n=1 Tax=Rhinatrema bivittatum TaxID=194408 RepID=UPI00112615CC|nr:uracil-DNA glycosylase-like [Rhinatrema bivittatum]